MPPTIRFCIITTVQPIRDDIRHDNNNGFFMIPGSSNQRVKQKVEMILRREVSKNIKVTRVKFCSPSHWMIFLTLTINERIEQGEEEALEFYTRTEGTLYETPNGWRIQKYVPRVSRVPRVPREEDYDMYMHNFGIPNGIIIEHSVDLSRIRLDDSTIDERLDQNRLDDLRTSINPRNRVDMNEPIVGILVNAVN